MAMREFLRMVVERGPSAPSEKGVFFDVIPFVTGVVTTVVLNTTAERTFAVAGLDVGDFVAVMKPTLQAGLGIVNARVSAENTLAITYSNNTGSSIQPANETCALIVARVNK
jgi:hypothetical protein